MATLAASRHQRPHGHVNGVPRALEGKRTVTHLRQATSCCIHDRLHTSTSSHIHKSGCDLYRILVQSGASLAQRPSKKQLGGVKVDVLFSWDVVEHSTARMVTIIG